MKCNSCKRENSDGVKFCKFCGSPLGGSYLTCVNGHNYESHHSKCPFCPSTDYEKTIMDKPAMMDISNTDKTIIDVSKPTLTKQESFQQNSDKTVIYNPEKSTGTTQENIQGVQRKLVGWFVTYDINSNGTDYRIYEGRTKIGKGRNNDMVINQAGITDEHAILLYRPLDKKFIIKDNLSTNGTFVNDQLIEDNFTLTNDDVVRIGKVNLKLKII